MDIDDFADVVVDGVSVDWDAAFSGATEALTQSRSAQPHGRADVEDVISVVGDEDTLEDCVADAVF